MTATVRPAPSARNVAFAVIRDVFGPEQRGAAESLDRRLRASALDARDRAFVTELAYGTIERRRWLDWQLAPYLGARAAKLPQMIAEILRMGTYQLRALRVRQSPTLLLRHIADLKNAKRAPGGSRTAASSIAALPRSIAITSSERCEIGLPITSTWSRSARSAG